MMSYQTETGAMIHHTAGGYDVIDNRGTTISHTATSVNLADAIRASASQQYDRSMMAASQSAQHYGESITTALRGVYDLAVTQGNGLSSDDTSTLSHSGGTSQNINNVKELVDRFASSHGLTTAQAVQALGAASASVSGSASISAGGIFGVNATAGVKGEISGLSRAESNQAIQAAHDFVKSERFSESLDTAARGIHDQHYRTSSDEGQRLTQNISNAFDQASTYREDMSNSLQQAESYRTTMNMTTEQAAAINQQGSQALVEWMTTKPAPGSTTGTMSPATADHILNHQPELAKAYADEFIKEKGITGHLNHSIGSPAQVQAAYNSQSISTSQQINNAHQAHQAMLEQQASSRGLGRQHKVNSGIAAEANSLIQNTHKDITSREADIEGKGYTKEQRVTLDTHPDNHDLASKTMEEAKEAVKSIFKSDKL